MELLTCGGQQGGLMAREIFNRIYAASRVIFSQDKQDSSICTGLVDICTREILRMFPSDRNCIVFYNVKKKTISKTPIYVSQREVINLCKIGLVPIPKDLIIDTKETL